MLIPLNPQPGIVSVNTDYTSQTRWIDADKVRFRYGRPEKIGGWESFLTDAITGTPRTIHTWRQLNDYRNIALGTESHLYVYSESLLTDATPYRVTSHSLDATDVDTTNTSSTVNISYTTHGAKVGARVVFLGSLSIGGLTLDGEYTITNIVDADNFEFDAGSNATSTASGGSVNIALTINPGTASAISGFGWGTGAWGSGTWGTARAASNVVLDMRVWSMDSYGEDLLSSYRKGPLYVWDASAGGRSTAVTGTQVPAAVGLVRVTEDRHTISAGATPQGSVIFDPMLVKWSNEEDYTDWDITNTTNTAGEQILTQGNEITAFVQGRSVSYIHTDTALYAMQDIGPPFVFGFNVLGEGCGCLGPNASTTVEDNVIWMGFGNFYIFDGSVRTLECPVIDKVFEDMNITQQEKVFAGLNRKFSEVWFFYPSADSTENDRYVLYNYREGTWSYGSIARTTWRDQGLYQEPIATAPSGTVYKHEIGHNDDGAIMPAYAETGVFEAGGEDGVGQGDKMLYMDRIIPDVELDTGGEMTYTVYTRRYPNSTDITKGSLTVTPTTEKISFRARGRQFRMRFETNDLDNGWRLGTNRMDIKVDGDR